MLGDDPSLGTIAAIMSGVGTLALGVVAVFGDRIVRIVVLNALVAVCLAAAGTLAAARFDLLPKFATERAVQRALLEAKGQLVCPSAEECPECPEIPSSLSDGKGAARERVAFVESNQFSFEVDCGSVRRRTRCELKVTNMISDKQQIQFDAARITDSRGREISATSLNIGDGQRYGRRGAKATIPGDVTIEGEIGFDEQAVGPSIHLEVEGRILDQPKWAQRRSELKLVFDNVVLGPAG